MEQSGNTPTSIKGMLQALQGKGAGVLQGTVTQANPLKIQVDGDDKLLLTAPILVVPRHLSDYTTACDIHLNDGAIDSVTRNDGAHDHGPSGGHSQYSGSGIHSHTSEGPHIHHQATFNITGATIKVHNALKLGEKVHLLAFNDGKKYYVLDRAVT